MSFHSNDFRRSVLGERQGKQSKGWRGGFRDRLDLPKEEATPILLMRAEYEDTRPDQIRSNGGTPPIKSYFPHIVHSLKLAASGPGSYRELPCAGNDCVCCYAKDGGDARVTTRTKFAMNVLHLSLYRKEQLKDKNGQALRYDRDGEHHRAGDPVMGWTEVVGRKDKKQIENNIDAELRSGNVTMYRRKYVDVGSGHLENLMLIAEMAAKRCFCGGNLAPTAFHCEKCDECLCDVENSNLTPKQVNEFAMSRQRCGACGHNGLSKIITICDSCDEPSPMSVFDVVAYVRKHGEGTNSTVICEKIVPLTEFQLANGDYLIAELAADAEGQMVPVWTEAVKDSMVQYDFEQVFEPVDAAYQASILKIPNPFDRGNGGGNAGGEPAQGARGYARTPTSGAPTTGRPGFRR